MQKDLVFFKKEGEEGVALTSTSANYIANLAKEMIQSIEEELSKITFFTTSVSLIDSDKANVINTGINKDQLGRIEEKLLTISQAKSLIAWLREAMRAKQNLIDGTNALTFEEWAASQGMGLPTTPVRGKILTAEEYYTSLPIQERNQFYKLETIASVIGKYIHPKGNLAVARQVLFEKVNTPNHMEGTGRDALIYTYTPTVETEDVEKVFFELQSKQREAQAQLNGMMHKCDLAIDASIQEVNMKYEAELKAYKEKHMDMFTVYSRWKVEECLKYRDLKILIPNNLLEIYKKVSTIHK